MVFHNRIKSDPISVLQENDDGSNSHLAIIRKSLDSSLLNKPLPPPNSNKPKRPLSLPANEQPLSVSSDNYMTSSNSSNSSNGSIGNGGGVATGGSNHSSPSSSSSGFLISPQSYSPPASRKSSSSSFKPAPPPKSNSVLFSVIYDKTSTGLKEIDIEDLVSRINLQRVILGRNALEVIPDRISELSLVNTLDVSYNKLKSIPASISNMQTLATLLLAGNQFLIPAKEYNQVKDEQEQVEANQQVKVEQEDGEIEKEKEKEKEEDENEESELHIPTRQQSNNNEESKSISFIASSSSLVDSTNKINISSITTASTLSTIPENVDESKEIDGNGITEGGSGEAFPSEFSYLANLTKVDLTSNIAPDWNGLTYLPPSLFWLGQINTLLASHCQLKAIQTDIQHLISLTHLDLSDNCLTQIPSEIGQLISLKTLILRSNQLEYLPSELSMLSNSLVHLDLSDNSLVELPSELNQLSKLETLNLSYNQLTAIPSEWFSQDDISMHSLCDLRIRSNRIAELPEFFFLSYCKFNHLDLSDNQLSALPTLPSDGTDDLDSLTTLLLFNNKLTELPEDLFPQIPSITTLNISGNQLTCLPTSLWSSCMSLSTLSIGYNQLKSFQLPEDSSYSLEELYLNGNADIQEFEYNESIDYFPSLRELNLASCKLKSIPQFVYKCTSLDKLDLSNNEIRSIDFKLKDIENLSVLNLNHNQLESIPTGLENSLKNIRILDISFNLLNEISLNILNNSNNDNNNSDSNNNSSQNNNNNHKKPTTIQIIHHHNSSDLSKQLGESCEIWTESKRFNIAMAEMMGRRPSMEDAFTIRGNFGSFKDRDLIALFDGHAGSMAATFSCKWFPQIVTTLIEKYPSLPPLQWLKQAYSEVSLLFKAHVNQYQHELKYCGATAAAVLIQDNHYYVSNIGDTRVVLCRNGKAKRLSFDHKPNEPSEEERIRKLGGFVISNQHTARVNGTLAVSRSIGDFYMEPFVIPDPYLSITESSDDDQFLIVACDGIWDELSDQTACDIVLNSPSLKDAAFRLKDFAYFKGSDDNITTIIVDLKKQF